MADDVTKPDNDAFGDNSVVGRAMRRLAEGKPAFEGEELEPVPPLEPEVSPKFKESAYMREDETIEMHFWVYDQPDNLMNRSYGCDDVRPGSAAHDAILRRHRGLIPGTGSIFIRHFDGRWVLSGASGVIASGDAANDPDSDVPRQKTAE
ncbi:MAG TPA: hypothetical protein V6D08_04925 [Candidatus Obscuribacterales bacterium]